MDSVSVGGARNVRTVIDNESSASLPNLTRKPATTFVKLAGRSSLVSILDQPDTGGK
jgi:hypothetical protein